MRLFSAIWPSEQAVRHLESELGSVVLPAGVRRVPAAKWHLTLAFYGDDADQDERAAVLDQRLTGLPAPALRLAGSGTFAGVLWIGARPLAAADADALAAIAAAAGAGERFRPHVTVARWHGRRRAAELAQPLAGYLGPAWTATEVGLIRSAGGNYVRAHGVPLTAW